MDDNPDEAPRNVRQRTAGPANEAEDMLLQFKGLSENMSFKTGSDIYKDHLGSGSVSDELLVETVRSFVDEWSSRDRDRMVVQCGFFGCGGCGGTHHVPMSTYEWAMGRDHPKKRFALWDAMTSGNLETSITVVPRLLRKVLEQTNFLMICLFYQLWQRKLFVSSREEELAEGGVFEAHFPRVLEVIRSSYDICLAELRVRVNLPDKKGSGWTLFDSTSTEQKMPRKHALMIFDPEELTAFQNLHAHVLKLLRQCGYRKFGDLLYEPVYSEHRGQMLLTGAWKPAVFDTRNPNNPSTFANFLKSDLGRHLDFEAYLDATSHPANRKEVLKLLVEEEEPECPTIMYNRNFISFRNAIVHMLGAVFPLDRPDAWQEIADNKNAEWDAFARASSDRLATLGVHVEPFDLRSRVSEATGEDMRIRPPTRDEATIHFIDEELPEELFHLRFDGSNFTGVERPEVNPAEPWDSPIFNYLDDIKTRDFDTVHKSQNFERATRFWDLVRRVLRSAHTLALLLPLAKVGSSLRSRRRWAGAFFRESASTTPTCSHCDHAGAPTRAQPP